LPVDKLTESPGEVTSFLAAVVRPVGEVNLGASLDSLGHGIRDEALWKDKEQPDVKNI
jgi:hypothetical protein